MALPPDPTPEPPPPRRTVARATMEAALGSTMEAGPGGTMEAALGSTKEVLAIIRVLVERLEERIDEIETLLPETGRPYEDRSEEPDD